MQITDSKEQVLLGVQRLRTIASSSSAASPPHPHPPPTTTLGLAMELPPVAASPASACPPVRSQQADGPSSSSRPVQLELLPLRPTSHRALQLNSSIFADSRWGGVGGNSSNGHMTHVQAPFRGGIDVNQIPSSPESEDDEQEDVQESQLQIPPVLHLSSVAAGVSLKRERPADAAADLERLCELSSRASDEEEGSGTRKKLRLSKDQSALLEESFKEHSTLNPKQKNALAKQLNLRPRQVEVWFQNRRARTKLKQTEVDCELLKRCCETLTEENRRLQKELQELRAIKVAAPCVFAHDFYMPLPAATLTMCPSCERLATTAAPASDGSRASSLLSSLNKPHHLHHHHLHHQFPQQQQPSAAC